jgi:lipopolysaccharide biosynthesis glycosyltransferase
MNGHRRTVAYAAASDYWEHIFVSLYSLLANNQHISFDVRILARTPDERFFANLAALRSVHGDFDVSWLAVDEPLLARVSSGHYSEACLYRLLLGRLLPEVVERVLYLDGDTIVRGSLAPLFELRLDDFVLAAVPHRYFHLPGRCPNDYSSRLGLTKSAPYLNSGVLLVNLKMWRDLGIEAQSLDYVRSHLSVAEKLEFPDQDTLNTVLLGKWLPLDARYNYWAWTVEPESFLHPSGTAARGNDAPVIVHYAGSRKPWHGGSRHPYELDYWDYRMRTPYANRMKLIRSRAARIVSRPLRYLRGEVLPLRRKVAKCTESESV